MAEPGHRPDSPSPGVAIHQPEKGFRYGSESFWVAGFALEGGVPHTAIDLGTGSGIVAALLAFRGVDALGVDLRAEWAPYWRYTLLETTVAGRLRLSHADIQGVTGKFDLAISNPPFFPAGSGPIASDPWRAAARTESSASLADFIRVGLRVADRLCLVIPASRVEEAVRSAEPSRRVQVGSQRTLLEFGGRAEPDAQVAESDPRVLGWYAAFNARPPAQRR